MAFSGVRKGKRVARYEEQIEFVVLIKFIDFWVFNFCFAEFLVDDLSNC